MAFRASPYRRTGTVVTTGSQRVLGSISIENDFDVSTTDALFIKAEINTPPAPSDGQGGVLYAKSDGKVYWRSFEQDEIDLTQGTGGGGGGGGGGGSGTVSSSFNNYISFYKGTGGSSTTTITGSSAFYWDNTNSRLGINTESPGYKFTIKSPSASEELISLDNTNDVPAIRLRTYNDAAGGMVFYNAGVAQHVIDSRGSGSADVSFNKRQIDSDFNIASSGSASMFHVDASTNRVGVGTASPQYAFHVDGNAGISGSNPTLYGSTSDQSLQLSNTQGVILRYGNDLGTVALDQAVYLQTQGFTRLTVKDEDKTSVGIGTTNPTCTFDVYHNSDHSLAFKVRAIGTGSAFTVQPNGKTGLNTASPTSRLHVKQHSDTSTEGLGIYQSSGTNSLRLWMEGTTGKIGNGSTAGINFLSSGFVSFPAGITDAVFQNGVVTGSLVVTGSDNTSLVTVKSNSNSSILDVNSNFVTSSVPVFVSSSAEYPFEVIRDGELAFRVRKQAASIASWQWDNNRRLDISSDTGDSFISLRPSAASIIFSKNMYTTNSKFGVGRDPSAQLDVSGSDASTLLSAKSDTVSSILTVAGTGKVGLGTLNNQAQLSIRSLATSATPFGIYGYTSNTKAVEFKVVSSNMGQLYLYRGGSTAFSFDAQTGASVFNEMGYATGDTRFESDTKTHMLFVDAGNDKVGIGTDSPDKALTVKGQISVHTGSIVINNKVDLSGSFKSPSNVKTIIDTYSTASCNMAKYTIHGIDNVSTDREVAEVILYHSGSEAHVSRTFTDYTGNASFMAFSGSVNGGHARLHVTCTNNSNTLTIMRNSLLA